MGPQKFLMKVITEVEAIRYMPGDGCNCADVAMFQDLDVNDVWRADCLSGSCADLEWTIETPTGHGEADVMPGDWIVKNDGYLWRFSNEEFEATFEARENY
jgi:hypothetical protein